MTAIEKKIKEHERDAHSLAKKYPDKKEPILRKQAEVLEAWSKLCDGSFVRKEKLGHSYTLHKFQTDLRELERWVEDIVNRMNASPLPSNTAEAEMLLQSHQEKKVILVVLSYSLNDMLDIYLFFNTNLRNNSNKFLISSQCYQLIYLLSFRLKLMDVKKYSEHCSSLERSSLLMITLQRHPFRTIWKLFLKLKTG